MPKVDVIVADIPSPAGSAGSAHSPIPASLPESPEACRPVTSRQIRWNWTLPGEVAIVPCPDGATGLARWACLSSDELNGGQVTDGQVTGGQWSGGQPDLSDCKSHGMSNLEVRVREEEQESVIAEALAELSK